MKKRISFLFAMLLCLSDISRAQTQDELKMKMLSIQEIRERLRKGMPLVLNKEANWNNEKQTSKDEYLDNYMAKNLYNVNCTLRNRK